MFSVLTVFPKGPYSDVGFVNYWFLNGEPNCHYMSPLNPAIRTRCSSELRVFLVTVDIAVFAGSTSCHLHFAVLDEVDTA
jgi:hypothetical protein